MSNNLLCAVVLLFVQYSAVGCGGGDDGGSTATGGVDGAGASTASGGAPSGGASSGGAAAGGASGSGGEVACRTAADVSAPSTSTSEACRAFCRAEDTCNPRTTVDNCYEYRNCAAEDTGEAACVAAGKIYWDCLRAQFDVCEPYECCDSVGQAYTAACNP